MTGRTAAALRPLAAVALLAAGIAACGSTGGNAGTGDAPKYWVELDNAFGLVQGGDMKVAGVRAGRITALDLDRRTLRALVQFQVTENGFGSLRADVTCDTRPQSLIGEYYLDCLPGTSAARIRPGTVIPVSRTTSTVAPDLVTDIFRLPYRERLRIIINELGAGAAGNAANLRAALRRASPALRETDRVLAILARQNRTLANLARDGDLVLGALAANRRDVARFVDTAGRTASVAAERQAALAEGIRRLPGFLAQLRPTMAALGDVAGKATPALQNLDASATQLKALLDRLGPFATVSRPAFRALGRAAVTGDQALTAAAPTINLLRQFAVPTPELAKNLNIVLGHLDDRSFAVEKDPRSPGGQGYTGSKPGSTTSSIRRLRPPSSTPTTTCSTSTCSPAPPARPIRTPSWWRPRPRARARARSASAAPGWAPRSRGSPPPTRQPARAALREARCGHRRPPARPPPAGRARPPRLRACPALPRARVPAVPRPAPRHRAGRRPSSSWSATWSTACPPCPRL